MGNDNNQETRIEGESRRGDAVAFYAAIVSTLVVFWTTWTIVLSSNPKALSWLAFHPTFNTLAVLCWIFGILTLQPTSQPKTKAAGLTRHQIAMLTSLLSVILGTSAVWTFKATYQLPHFKSWHGFFGLITFIWFIIQGMVGAGSVWFGGAAFGGGLKAKQVWKYHRLSGYMLLILLLTTIYFAGRTQLVSFHSSYVVRLIAYTLAPIFILVSVCSRVRPSKMKFF